MLGHANHATFGVFHPRARCRKNLIDGGRHLCDGKRETNIARDKRALWIATWAE